MSTTPKIFNQAKPAGTQVATLYTVPPAIQAQLTIFVANQSTGLEHFRIALVPVATPGIAEPQPARYIAYDTPLIGNGVFAMSGIGLNSGESIYVQSDHGDISFTATGIEFS